MLITVSNQFATEVLNLNNNHFYRSLYLSHGKHWLRDQVTEQGIHYIEVKPKDMKHAKAVFNLTGSLYETLYAVNPERLLELCIQNGFSDQ